MPNTIADNLARLQTARTDIANAITTKGGTVAAGDGFEDFPADIATIQSIPNIDDALKSTCPQITNITEKFIPYKWITKTWNNAPTYNANNQSSSPIWTDGTDIYYSAYSNQYVLNKATSTWSTKTWGGTNYFSSVYIWTDGTDIYYSGGSSSDQYVLDKATSTWLTKTWTGLTNFDGIDIWTDGTDIYYSGGSSSDQYVLDKATSTWSTKTWGGMDRFYNSKMYGRYIWTNGVNIINSYYSNKSYDSVLNRSNSTWVAPAVNTSMPTNSNYDGDDIWTDGSCLYLYRYVYFPGAPAGQMYHDMGSNINPVKKQDIWTDGTDIYYRFSYKLAKVSPANVTVNTVKCIPQFIK